MRSLTPIAQPTRPDGFRKTHLQPNGANIMKTKSTNVRTKAGHGESLKGAANSRTSTWISLIAFLVLATSLLSACATPQQTTTEGEVAARLVNPDRKSRQGATHRLLIIGEKLESTPDLFVVAPGDTIIFDASYAGGPSLYTFDRKLVRDSIGTFYVVFHNLDLSVLFPELSGQKFIELTAGNREKPSLNPPSTVRTLQVNPDLKVPRGFNFKICRSISDDCKAKADLLTVPCIIVE